MGIEGGHSGLLGKHSGSILKSTKALKESQRGALQMGLSEGKGMNPQWAQLVNKRSLSSLINNQDNLFDKPIAPIMT